MFYDFKIAPFLHLFWEIIMRSRLVFCVILFYSSGSFLSLYQCFLFAPCFNHFTYIGVEQDSCRMHLEDFWVTFFGFVGRKIGVGLDDIFKIFCNTLSLSHSSSGVIEFFIQSADSRGMQLLLANTIVHIKSVDEPTGSRIR